MRIGRSASWDHSRSDVSRHHTVRGSCRRTRITLFRPRPLRSGNDRHPERTATGTGYKGERVATRYSFAFSGVELLIRIPKNSLTPSLEIVSPIPLSVMASSCLNVVQQSDSLIRIEIGRSCVSDDAGAGYVVLRDGLVEKRIDLSMVRVGTVTDQNSL